MRITIIFLTLIFTFPTISKADDRWNEPQELNDGLTTGSGIVNESANPAQMINYKFSQEVAECRNSENQLKNGGRNAADASTAYYECLQRMVSN